MHGAHVGVGELGAALVYVEGADGGLPGRRRGIAAVPAVAAIPRLKEIAQRIGLLALLRARPWVGDDAQTSERAGGIEQCRHDYRKIQHLCAVHIGQSVSARGALSPNIRARRHNGNKLRAGRSAGPALVVIGPAGERLLRRAAIAAAGIVDESFVRQRWSPAFRASGSIYLRVRGGSSARAKPAPEHQEQARQGGEQGGPKRADRFRRSETARQSRANTNSDEPPSMVLEFRRRLQQSDIPGIPAADMDGDELLAAHRVADRRRGDRGADIETPQRLSCWSSKASKGAVDRAGEDEAARGRQHPGIVRVIELVPQPLPCRSSCRSPRSGPPSAFRGWDPAVPERAAHAGFVDLELACTRQCPHRRPDALTGSTRSERSSPPP